MTLRESQQVQQWAYRTFGELELGNRQRTRRVVSVARSLAARAAGTVTEVFADSAEREGAYRLLSNESITAEQLRAGMCDATVRCDRPAMRRASKGLRRGGRLQSFADRS